MKRCRRDGNQGLSADYAEENRQTPNAPYRYCLTDLCNLRNLRIESPPKARDQTLVHFARDAHVVQIVFANLGQPAGLIQIEDFAAFDFSGLARFNPQRPGKVVEADAVATAKP